MRVYMTYACTCIYDTYMYYMHNTIRAVHITIHTHMYTLMYNMLMFNGNGIILLKIFFTIIYIYIIHIHVHTCKPVATVTIINHLPVIITCV